MNKLFVSAVAAVGALSGALTWLWQFHLGHMQVNIHMAWELPFLMFAGASIVSGSVVFVVVMIGGVLELLDKDAHWPHV